MHATPLAPSVPPALALSSLLFIGAACAPEPTLAPSEASEASVRVSPPKAEKSPPVWLGLEPGPYRVGYRQELRFDPTRSYDNPLAPLPERPILINRWYPADGSGEPMLVDDYLDVAVHDESGFAELLERHVREVMANEALPDANAVANRRELLERMLAEPVLARRGAQLLPGAWPVVLYHPGLGGAFADNFVLFELLASHGYLVVSSAFVPSGEAHFAIDWDPSTSIADLDFLVHELSETGELGHEVPLAVTGHSYGAQAALIYAMQGRRVDAVISIDSTLENGDPEAPWFYREEKWKWFERGQTIRVPSLIMVSQYHSQTRFVDAMTESDRRLVVVPTLGHNDFVSHGGALLTLHAHSLRDPESGPASHYAQSYAWELRTIHAFLDGVLGKDASRLADLDDDWASSIEGASIVHMDIGAHEDQVEADP